MVLDKYLEVTDLAESTLAMYESYIRRVIRPRLGDTVDNAMTSAFAQPTPAHGAQGAVLALQPGVGNHATSELIRHLRVSRGRTTVLQRCGSHPCPAGGCESDAVDIGSAAGPTLARAAVYGGADGGHGPGVAPPLVDSVLRSSGQPLDAVSRNAMESRFGHDFSAVRLHTDGQAARSARAVDASAYTVGSHIVVGEGFVAGSAAGQRMLAHELVHVIQQEGAVPGLQGATPALDAADPLEQEAHAAPRGFNLSRRPIHAGAPDRTRDAHPMLLQRKCACGGKGTGATGNCEECRSGERSLLQAKLRINEPGDAFEQEADRIAEQVTTSTAQFSVDRAPPRVQRVATASNGPTSTAPPSVSRALADPGQPLERGLRWRMEDRFRQDFSRVRVHSGAAAAQSARDVDALGYTVGNDIVFGAGRFAPETVEGRKLLAHELTHVLQQSSGDAHAGASIQRSPDKPVPKPKQVAFQVTFDRPLSREEFIDLAENTIYGRRTPGGWEGVPEHFDAEDSPVTVWVPASTVESEARKGIDELRPDIREFLMKQRPARDYAGLDSLRRAGEILELSGITEDELLLMDYRRGQGFQQGRKIDPAEWAQQILLERQAVTLKAISNRESLVEAIGRLEYLSEHDKKNLKDVREGEFIFEETVDYILTHGANLRVAPLVEQFEFELKSITEAFLAQANVVLIRIEKTYLANKNIDAEKEALREAIEKIRPALRQRDEAAREEERQSMLSALRFSRLKEMVFGERDTELDRARKAAEETEQRFQQRSKEAGLPVAGWEKFDLDAIRGADVNVSRNHLRYFVDSARATLIKAEEKTRDIKNLYKADRMVTLTKAAIGIKDGSPMDDIITARAREATSDGGFWSTVWDVVTIALMFVPGNIGIALRIGAGLINAAEAGDQYSEDALMHEARLTSEAPSSLGVWLAVGGTLVDAGDLAKGVFKAGEGVGLAAKFGSEASSAESTAVREGQSAGIRAGEGVAERKAGQGLSQAEMEIAAEARPISEDVADRMTKATYSGGGHEFKVLSNGRVVRCSPICGDADVLLKEAYEDVFRANEHLLADLDRLTELIHTNPNEAAELARDLERRCQRLSGSAFEDVGGPLQPTTRGRAGGGDDTEDFGAELITERELSKERGIQPGHLREGVEWEDKELLRRGLTQKDKIPWEPGPGNLNDPMFKQIVGKPEFTEGGQLIGCILDGPGLEIKSGSSVLESTYQLRLMVYRSQLLAEPLELCTSRPIESGFKAWLIKYGVKITLLKP